MPNEPTDDQIRAEVQTILNGGDTPAPTAAPAAAAPDPAAAAPADAPAQPPAQEKPAEFQLDEKAQRAIASQRRVQEAIARERQQLAAEQQQHRSQLEDAAKMVALQQLAKTGKAGAILRALGVTPGKDHAEDMLADALGDEAPEGLRMRAEMAALRRDQAAFRQEQEAWRRGQEEQQQRTIQEQQQVQQRQYVRNTLVPQFGDKTAIVRALTADPEFADGIINTGIQQYTQMASEQGEVEPFEAFAHVEQRLERMVLRIAEDPAAWARITKAVEAKKPKQTPPAEKQQPAPTLSNQQHTGTTPPAASDWKSYEEQVRKEAEAMFFKRS